MTDFILGRPFECCLDFVLLPDDQHFEFCASVRCHIRSESLRSERDLQWLPRELVLSVDSVDLVLMKFAYHGKREFNCGPPVSKRIDETA